MLPDKYNPLEEKVLRVLDVDGKVLDESLIPQLSDEKLLHMYKTMLLTRSADNKALQYQRQGRMLTYIPNFGQEAAQIGTASALEDKDWLIPAFREMGAWLTKGATLEQLYLYFYGTENGSHFDENVRMLPISVPIASQLVHAVGIAMASNYKGEPEVSMTYVGDGGTSEGTFYEAMNYAGVFNAPVVFVVQNNGYAISTRRINQTNSKTIAQKAVAAGIPGIMVDGNDIFAVYTAAKEAVERARSGGGPTLIEAVTYRIGAHTTNDDPTKYRDESEVELWKGKNPITRFKNYLINKGIWSEEKDAQQIAEFDSYVMDTFKKVEAIGNTELEDIFKYQYAEMPKNLREQYEEYKAYLEGGSRS
jgi:pyruvate dehydrogenase E1 component alpha subunit